MFITTIFLVTFISLSLWFLFKDEKEMSSFWGKLFLGSFATFMGTSLLLPGFASWTTLGIHLAFLFGGGFVLNTFSNNKIIFVSLMLLMAGGYFYLQTGVNPWPFEQQTTTVSTAPQNTNPDNELLIEVSEGHQVAELNAVINQYGLEVERAFAPQDAQSTELDDYYTVNIPQNQESAYAQIVEALQASTLVDHIEANELLTLDPLEAQKTPPPNDGKYTVNDPDLDKVWGFEAMQVQRFYDFVSQNNLRAVRKAKIAIIDTGVDGNHEDLKANYVSTQAQYDNDAHGHGTHCAGIAAAVSNNNKGIASLSPNNQFVEVTSIKVFGKYGNTSQRKIISGMIEAVDNGADVLSMSLGGPSSDRIQRAYKQAVDYANRHGAIVVVAAGNENMDASRRAPASVNGVITVSAINDKLDKAKFSNDISKLNMGITAPGVQVYSTIPDNNYEFFNGTSMATPYVAGLLGVMKSLKPELKTKQAFRILQQTGTDTRYTKVTGKLINPSNAIKVLLN